MKKKIVVIGLVAAALSGCDVVQSFINPEKEVTVQETPLPKVDTPTKDELAEKAVEVKTETEDAADVKTEAKDAAEEKTKVVKAEPETVKTEVMKAEIAAMNAESTNAVELKATVDNEQVKADYALFNEAKNQQQAVIQAFQKEMETVLEKDLSPDELNQFLKQASTKLSGSIEALKNLDMRSDVMQQLKSETIQLFMNTQDAFEKTIALVGLTDNDQIVQAAKEIEESSRNLIDKTFKVEQLESQIIQRYNLTR